MEDLVDDDVADSVEDEERDLGTFYGVGPMLIPIIIGVAITLFPGPVASLFQPDSWAVANAVILFTLAALLAVLWYKASTDEQRVFKRLGKSLFPLIHGYGFLLVIAAVVALLMLMLTAYEPVLFGLVLLGTKVLESWNTALATPSITEKIGEVWAAKKLPTAQKNRRRTLDEWKLEADAIYTFYFGHRWYQLAVAEGVVIAFATVAAAYVMRDPNPDVRHVGLLMVTLLLATAIVGNEFFNGLWRAQRDRELGALAHSQLSPWKPMSFYQRRQILSREQDQQREDVIQDHGVGEPRSRAGAKPGREGQAGGTGRSNGARPRTG
jgi:hypothetical protein